MEWIPVGMDYQAAVKGQRRIDVTCEKCEAVYSYVLTRTSRGGARSVLFLDNAGAEQRAEHRARKGLDRLLSRGCDAVPCPDCGWLQKDMVSKIRFWRSVIIIAIALTAGAVVAGWISQGVNDVPIGEEGPIRRQAMFFGAITLLAVATPLMIVFLNNINRNHRRRSEDFSSKPTRAVRRKWGKSIKE